MSNENKTELKKLEDTALILAAVFGPKQVIDFLNAALHDGPPKKVEEAICEASETCVLRNALGEAFYYVKGKRLSEAELQEARSDWVRKSGSHGGTIWVNNKTGKEHYGHEPPVSSPSSGEDFGVGLGFSDPGTNDAKPIPTAIPVAPEVKPAIPIAQQAPRNPDVHWGASVSAGKTPPAMSRFSPPIPRTVQMPGAGLSPLPKSEKPEKPWSEGGPLPPDFPRGGENLPSTAPQDFYAIFDMGKNVQAGHVPPSPQNFAHFADSIGRMTPAGLQKAKAGLFDKLPPELRTLIQVNRWSIVAGLAKLALGVAATVGSVLVYKTASTVAGRAATKVGEKVGDEVGDILAKAAPGMTRKAVKALKNRISRKKTAPIKTKKKGK